MRIPKMDHDNEDHHRRLTIVHTDFHRGWGGQINRVLTACAELRRRGHRIILALPAGGRPAARAAREAFEVCDDLRFRKTKYVFDMARDAWTLRNLLRETGADVVHSHGSQDTWAVAIANTVLPGAPRTVHLLTRHNTKRVRDTRANRWLISRAIDRLVVVDRSVLERYRPFLTRGELDSGEIAVIPSPLRPDFHSTALPKRSALREELGRDDTSLLIGTAARLAPDKGQKYLLEAAAKLLPRFSQIEIVLAGNGVDTDRLTELAGKLGIAARVHFLGYREDVATVLAALDIAVLPSIDCDASSGMLKEALALGIPTVATDIGGARTILDEGRFGRIVEAGNADALAEGISETLCDLEQARIRARAGGEHIRAKYTVEGLGDALEAVYFEALAARGKQTAKTSRKP